MALYEHIHVQWHIQAFAQFLDSRFFILPAAIREKDKGDAIGLEVGEGSVSTRQRVGAAEKDTIDATQTSA